MKILLLYAFIVSTCYSDTNENKNDLGKYQRLVQDFELCFYPDNLKNKGFSEKQLLLNSSLPSTCIYLEEGKQIIAKGESIVPFLLKYKTTSYHIRGCIAFLIMEIYGWELRDFTPFDDYDGLLNQIEEKIENEFNNK